MAMFVQEHLLVQLSGPNKKIFLRALGSLFLGLGTTGGRGYHSLLELLFLLPLEMQFPLMVDLGLVNKFPILKNLSI